MAEDGGRPAQSSSIRRSRETASLAPEKQDRKQGARLGGIERDDTALGHHLERPEETDFTTIVPEPRTTHKDAASTGARPQLDRPSDRPPAPLRRIEQRHSENGELA